MSNLLITSSERNTLLCSCFLATTEETNDIYNLLSENARLTEAVVADNSQVLRIKRRLSDWLHASYMEWTIDTSRSPYEATNKEKKDGKYRCAFCHSPLSKGIVFIKNKESKTVETIGLDCSKNLGTPETTINSEIGHTVTEKRRYERLIKQYPTLDDYMRQGKKYPNNLEFVVSMRLSDKFDTTFRTVKDAEKAYLKAGTFNNKARGLSAALTKHERVINELHRFEVEAQQNPNFYLSQKILMDEIRISNESDIDLLRSQVMRNDGLVDTNVASQIRNINFLEKVAIRYNKMLDGCIRDVAVLRDGKFHVNIVTENNKLGFELSSNKLIAFYAFPTPVPRDTSLKAVSRSFNESLVPDTNCRRELLAEFFKKASNSFGMRQWTLSADEVWSRPNGRQIGWIQARYANTLYLSDQNDIWTVDTNKAVELMKSAILSENIEDLKKNDIQNVSLMQNRAKILSNARRSFEIEEDRTSRHY